MNAGLDDEYESYARLFDKRIGDVCWAWNGSAGGLAVLQVGKGC